MPKVKINYAEMLFYKISCLSPNITKVFIGHTTNVNQRKHILKKQTQSEIYYSDIGQMAYISRAYAERPPEDLYDDLAYQFQTASKILRVCRIS